jgi:predicted phosphodiesterase
MRILIISDIHANLAALEAVLEDAGHFDSAWCLGDLVGYGPDPNECIQRISGLPGLQCIVGNHDAAALRTIDAEAFNPEARQAIYWTQTTLTEASLSFLKQLPEVLKIQDVTLAHGSPRHPVWEYILDTQTAGLSFPYFDTPFCFVGHSHMPVIFNLIHDNGRAKMSVPEIRKQLTLSGRAILNPGSVGQPRDRDPRAAYALFDPEIPAWEYRRVPYDIASVQSRMAAARLPLRHIERLSSGW